MNTRLKLILTAASGILLTALVGSVYAFAVFLRGIGRPNSLNPLSVRIALSCAFLAGALILYLVKKSKYQYAYGLLEVAVGLVSNWQSLDNWFHPTAGSGAFQILYARLAIIAAGTYLISRGISNAIEGFVKFFDPAFWSKIKPKLSWADIKEGIANTAIEGAYSSPLGVKTKHLKWKYLIIRDQIESWERKKQEAESAGKDAHLIEKRLVLLREQLRVVSERYEMKLKAILRNTTLVKLIHSDPISLRFSRTSW